MEQSPPSFTDSGSEKRRRVEEPVERQQVLAVLKAIVPYLPRPVVTELWHDPAVGRVKGEHWQGSVLFADLSGFTALSETLSALGKKGAEEITRIVNALFGALLEDIDRYRGVLLKFGGDAVTVYFGGPNNAWRAARTGLALQETMARQFVKLETAGGIFTLRLRVGVHTGEIFAAQVGHEPGYPLRGMELVVTGPHINRVASAQDCAAPGQVCITATTLDPIRGQAQVQTVDDGTGEGLYWLQALSPLPPSEPLVPLEAPLPLEEAPLARLQSYLYALRPYLPVDLTDERITDPAAPELRPDLRPVAILFANFRDMSAILQAVAEKGEPGIRVATQILNRYYTQMQEIIGRYGGILNKVDMYTHGDKLMAVFGAPLAHGDDAERAVRAALEMQSAMPEVNRHVAELMQQLSVPIPPLTQRIGLNYGHVFAGNVGSERAGSRHEYTVMGDSVNLAARLMAAAEQDDMLVSPSVRRSVADKFRFQDLAPQQVKGKAQPVSVSRPLRVLTKSEQRALKWGRRPFVGREAPLEGMQRAARLAQEGQGQVIVVTGEAGTGKTRLIEAFQERLRQPAERVLFDYYTTDLPSYALEPYAPIIDLLRRVGGLEGTTINDIARLREWVQERVPDRIRFLPLLGALLALPIPDNLVTAAFTPEQRRDRLFDLVEALFHSQARYRPLVLVVDDLQWTDASSLSLIERLAHSANVAPLLLILSYRPEVSFATSWVDLPYCHVMAVTEFSRQENRQLVAELLEADDLPEALAETVWSRAQGNAFFTEELVKSLRETETLVRRNGRWELQEGQGGITAIPDTIEGIVLARLDRLESRCRDVLQEASVAAAGQPRFNRPLLQQVDPHPREVGQRLRELVTEGLLEQLESELETLDYHFRQALVRDVAYDTMLYARRRTLHRLIAQAIEALYANRLDEYVTSLAHHYSEAEDWAQAFDYERRAAERAQVLFANRDAILHFRRALDLAHERQVARSDADVMDLYERLGDVLLLEGRYDQALEAYEAARALLAEGETPAQMAALCRKTAMVYERKADFPAALAWLERGLQILGERDVVEKARIYNFGGGVFYRQGERELALDWRQQALQIAERLEDQSEIANAYLLMAIIYSDAGEVDRALDFGRRCLDAFRAAQDLTGSAKALHNIGIISRRADDWVQAAEHFREGLQLSETMGDGMRIGQFANSMGEVYLDQGRLEEAREAYQRSISVWQPSGFLVGVAAARLNLGKVAVMQGNLEMAEAHLSEALGLAQEIGARLFLPEIHQWQAFLHLKRGQHPEALDHARQAHELARELKDRSGEGQALRVWGQIYADLGQFEQALERLESSLAFFADQKSAYQAAKTCFQLALVYFRSGRRAPGQALIDQSRVIFAELGAQWDLEQVRKKAV